MGKLVGKVAVVTGGGTGIGRAICLEFAKEQAKVVVVSNVLEQAEAVAKEINERDGCAKAYDVDVTDIAALHEVAKTVNEEFGQTDILVTSAGVMGARDWILNTTVEAWRNTIEVNLNAGFYCLKAFLPGMVERDSGRVIMISSTSGKQPAALNSDYAASKHGVIGLTKALSLELGLLKKNGITANAICPGSVNTPMIEEITTHLLDESKMTKETFVKKNISSKNIQRRLLDAEEIAHMAVYLASDQARGVTGQALNVCAGTVLS